MLMGATKNNAQRNAAGVFDFARRGGIVFLTTFLAVLQLSAQTAALYGVVFDSSKLPVPNAQITVENAGTSAARDVSSNHQGAYSASSLQPGRYHITVQAGGFKTIRQNDVILEVDQHARIDFSLEVGSQEQHVVVEGNAPLLNSSDASVSTLIGERFVETLPLNGRSFSALIGLAPGVVLVPATDYEQGQFSVNGQRPDANYFLVDGVSANFGSAGGGELLRQGGGGQLPATNAVGGTSNLVSLDALQEFRILTSTFAPEYGRTPGAQISVVTKSGTNVFHGTAFEYFRNDKLDANDWFANRNALARPELRQNDFGGVLGGPIRRNKLFFFGSYEGLRVRQPKVAQTYVPSLASRQTAAAAVQPLLNAFPKPNGPDLGNGTGAFSAGYSDPSSLDSSGIRFDYLPSARITVFARYADAPSNLGERGNGSLQGAYSAVTQINYGTQTATIGLNHAITPRLINEVRFNYSRSRAHNFTVLDNFGGAVPPSETTLFPSFVQPDHAAFSFSVDSTPYGLRFSAGESGNNLQQQINVIDNVSLTAGTHQIKLGIDYRRIDSGSVLPSYEQDYSFFSLPHALQNMVPFALVIARNDGDPQLVFSNWSLFGQDTWKVTPTLTMTYGFRWEYDAAPSSPNGTLPSTVTQVSNLATMTLAPPGTPLWHAQKRDFAPRLGIAWHPALNVVLRAGAGIFYDLGYSDVANVLGAFPFARGKAITNTSFPLSAAEAVPPPLSTTPPVTYMVVVDPKHILPRTYEWNASVESTLGKAGVVTVTYLGAAGRKLMRQDDYYQPNSNFTGEVEVMSNGADSSYNALQTQFIHRFAHGLQTLLSYTWAHSIDNVSSDVYFANVPASDSTLSRERGSSDYDIRQTFSSAVSYNIPAPRSGAWKAILGNWSTDSIMYARSAPPVNVVTGLDPFPLGVDTGVYGAARPDLISGIPLWIANRNVAGGKEINPAAFRAPTGAVQGDLGRNALRGFGATQVDLTVRRQFKLRERLSLQARADLFNVFNHPDFGSPVSYITSPLFGQAVQTLSASLGSGGSKGGINPLYQIGGPRSVQLALKLIF
jgi:hypothetical protein